MDFSSSEAAETSEEDVADLVPPREIPSTSSALPSTSSALPSTSSALPSTSSALPSTSSEALVSPVISYACPSAKDLLSTLKEQPKGEESLFNHLRCLIPDIEQIVTAWKNLYETDQDQGLLLIAQLIVYASGRTGKVKMEMMMVENCASLLKLPMDHQTKRNIFPIVRSDYVWKCFRDNYVRFFQTLVKSCQEFTPEDSFLISRLYSFVRVLMKCSWWPMRHVALLTGLKITTPLIEIFMDISDETIEIFQTSSGGVIPGIEEKLHGFKWRRIKSHFDFVARVVLPMGRSERFRAMRFLVINEIDEWIPKRPDSVLTDSYLRYLQISLDDKVDALKMKAMKSIQNMIEIAEDSYTLGGFVRGIKTALCKLVSDKDPEIAAQAMSLLNILVSKHYDIRFEEYIHVYGQIYNANPVIGRAAGEFLHARILDTLDSDEPVNLLCKRYINYILEFSLGTEQQQNYDLLVDSMVETEPYLKNWESYAQLLLGGFNLDESSRFSNNVRELALIEIMTCSVKQTLTNKLPRGPRIRKEMPLFSPSIEADETTPFFIQKLPDMVEKFLPNVEKVSRLLQIPQYLDLCSTEFYFREANARRLIETFKNAADVHPESQILKYFIKTVEKYSRLNVSWGKELETMLTHTIQTCVEKTFSLINLQDQDVPANIEQTLATLEIFFEHRDLNKYNVIDQIFPFLQLCLRESTIEPAAFGYALHCSLSSLTWKIKEIFHLEDTEEKNKAIVILHESFQKSVDLYESVIASSPIPQAQSEALYVLCEFLKYESKNKTQIFDRNLPLSQRLTFRPHERVFKTMSLFVKSAILPNDDEETAETLKDKQDLLTVYCEMFELGIIPIELAIDVLQSYSIRNEEYGIIIFSMMHNIFGNDKAIAFGLINSCLQRCFLEVIKEGAEFSQLKDLAICLATIFPLDRDSRASIFELHQISILFTFCGWNYSENENPEASTVFSPPDNLRFLEILIEFVGLLHENDKATVLHFLDSRARNITRFSDCLPFTEYRAELRRRTQTKKRRPRRVAE